MTPAGASSLALPALWPMALLSCSTGKSHLRGRVSWGQSSLLQKSDCTARPRLKWEEGVSQLRNSRLSPGKPWGEESRSEPRPRATATTAALALGHARAPGTISHPSCFRTPLWPHNCRGGGCFCSRHPRIPDPQARKQQVLSTKRRVR